MTSTALVLVTTDLSDPAHHADLLVSAHRLDARLAAVQGTGTSLSTLLGELADQALAPSAVRLAVVPGALPGTGPSWVRRVAAHWVRSRPTTPFVVEVVPGSATSAAWEDVERHVAGPARAVTGDEAPLRSPSWEGVPDHGHHLLLCRGPRCSARGASATADAIGADLRRRGWGDETVLVAQTGCLYPCNHAPVVCVYPEGRWAGPIHADDVPALLDGLDPSRGPAPGEALSGWPVL